MIRLALATWVVSVAAVAQAASHPLIALEVDPCVGVAPAELRRWLALEAGTPLAEARTDGATLATVGCAEGHTTLRVDDPVTNKSLLRSVDVPAGPTRARLLAIAVAELISASWTELERAPQVPPVGAPPSPTVRAAALAVTRKPPRFRYAIDAIGIGRGWFSGVGFLGGGGLRFYARFPYHLGLALDLTGAGGRASTPIGSVTISEVSGAALLVAHQDWTRVSIEVGAGLRVGGVHLVGNPAPGATGGSGSGVWLGPAASVGVSAEPVRRLHVGLFGEIGYAVVGVPGNVDGAATVSFEGVWLGFQATIGILL